MYVYIYIYVESCIMYCQYITTKFQLGFDTWKSGYTPQNNKFHGENKPMDYRYPMILFSDKPNTPWWNLLSTFHHMAGTEKNLCQQRGWIGSMVEVSFLSATCAALAKFSTYCKPWHPKSAWWSHMNESKRLVFFRRPSVSELKKVPGRGPKLRCISENGGFPSQPRWGTWNMPCLCSPKMLRCSSAASQRPRTGIWGFRLLSWTFQVFLVGFVARIMKNYGIYLYMSWIQLKWTSGEVSSYLVTCQAAFWIFWMVLRTSRWWASIEMHRNAMVF